ncbi:MAG: GNAT family N-acetyltransferase [Defluviitaleaceae bacterium]|nr:GNAT family N-acetyltransferase [Defluviitaleaceae bacterium]
MIRFVLPCTVHTEEYESKANEYIREFREDGSTPYGSGGLAAALDGGTYAEWVGKHIWKINVANVEYGSVPAFTYFVVRERDGSLIGICNIRISKNGFLCRDAGHISYSVRPTERNKGYATEILTKAASVCHTVGLNDIVVTCDADNHASAAVIRKCGGVLEEEFYSDSYGCMLQRYWIKRI